MITQIVHGMQGQYSRVPMPPLLCSEYHVYAVKLEYKQCKQMSGGINKPLQREEDSYTLQLILFQEYFS
jgi:hypothetical protein